MYLGFFLWSYSGFGFIGVDAKKSLDAYKMRVLRTCRWQSSPWTGYLLGLLAEQFASANRSRVSARWRHSGKDLTLKLFPWKIFSIDQSRVLRLGRVEVLVSVSLEF